MIYTASRRRLASRVNHCGGRCTRAPLPFPPPSWEPPLRHVHRFHVQARDLLSMAAFIESLQVVPNPGPDRGGIAYGYVQNCVAHHSVIRGKHTSKTHGIWPLKALQSLDIISHFKEPLVDKSRGANQVPNHTRRLSWYRDSSAASGEASQVINTRRP